MSGRDWTRNPVSPEKGAPVEWNGESGLNIVWRAELGGIVTSEPVVAGGLVWIGTNNDSPRDPARRERGGVLVCFRERDGAFLYQHLTVVTNHPLRRRSEFGMTSSPLIEGDRLWFVTTASEIMHLDIGPLRRGEGTPKPVWRIDMVSELGVHPAVDIMGGKGQCSLASSHGDLIYVITGNGTDWTREKVPAPDAPALVCLHKITGRVVWMDRSPGTGILFGEFASPLVIEAGGVAQVIAPQGDGWIRSFEAETGRLLWKFDINPKSYRQKDRRNFFLNSPVFHEGRVYIAAGRDVEWGTGPGRLVCLDPTRRGDVSLELEVGAGEGTLNPKTAAVWHFDQIGRSISNVAIHEGLVVVSELGGLVHCLDGATGRPQWKHDARAYTWGSPLIVDGKIYVGTEDGEVLVFALSRNKSLLFTARWESHVTISPIYASPIFANGVLYIATQNELLAIRRDAWSRPVKRAGRP